MEFEEYLKENAKKLEKELGKILSQFLKEVKKTNPKLVPFAKKFVNSCEGGKRIRGVLCKLGYELASSKFKIQNSKLNDEIFKVGIALEILHTALLIHDDIIDQSPKRRGKPSLYQSLGGNHYGISQAISLGDIGLYLPVKIITETNFQTEFKLKVLNYLSQILINTGWGQVMDLEKNKDIYFVNLYKTAKYTIAGPLQIGAMFSGAEERVVKKLGEFGEKVGIAFQLQDDILDKEVKDIEKTRVKALEYAKSAVKLIPQISKQKDLAKILESMAEYSVKRTQ